MDYVIRIYHLNTAADCVVPTPPGNGSIDNFQSAAEGANITYSCSPGFVPRTQMSAVCMNMTWRPDPATLQCREPLPGELGEYVLLYLASRSLLQDKYPEMKSLSSS